jgi:surfactin synthase thioesterase subunit
MRKTQLVCLPFGGSGAAFFHPWSEFAGDHIEVVPMRLPGRERLIDVEPYRNLHDAVDSLLADLLEELDSPARVALFGHSVGAVLAYELAHRLCAVPDVEILRLFASGSPAPGTQRTLRATGIADDDEFLARVRLISGYTHEALDHPEIRELILPTLRADVEMHENYVPSTTEPLPVPITALRGTGDELVSADQLAEWAQVTTSDFQLVELPGKHMYLIDSAEPLMSLFKAAVHSDSVV